MSPFVFLLSFFIQATGGLAQEEEAPSEQATAGEPEERAVARMTAFRPCTR
jgi:hypothetical protein